jgi:CheY-like chemotaxis protein
MASRPVVLVIDGDQDTRDLYALSLALEGFAVETARSGTEGLGCVAQCCPAAIVTDLSIRDCDGWQLIRLLKNDARTRDIPIIVVTAWLQPTQMNLAWRSLCAAFMTKPCTPDALAGELRRILGPAPTTSGAARSNSPERVVRGEPWCRLKPDRRKLPR